MNKKAIQSFLGKINFLRKCISDYAQIVKPMQEMIKKDTFYNWGKREKDAFSHIKSVLYSLYFSKEFLIYTFTSNTSLAIVLTQKDDLNNEWPISFMSTSLQGPELNYPIVEKKSYEVYNVMKHFRPYFLKNHWIIFVPHPAVKSLLFQQELGERRVN